MKCCCNQSTEGQAKCKCCKCAVVGGLLVLLAAGAAIWWWMSAASAGASPQSGSQVQQNSGRSGMVEAGKPAPAGVGAGVDKKALIAQKMQEVEAAREAKDWKKMKEALLAGMDLSPEDGSLRVMLAWALAQGGELDRARDLALASARNDPQGHGAYRVLAEVYAREGKVSLAINQMNKALMQVGSGPEKEEYVRTFAALLRRDNRPGEAMWALEQLTAESKSRLEVMDEMALCLGMLRKPEDAVRMYEKKLAGEPGNEELKKRVEEWRLKL